MKNRGLILENARNAWRWPQPEAWLRDLRYGLRMMARRPSFAATVVATLALGIGATVTLFSMIDTVVIRPLPYAEPGRLAAVQDVRLTGDRRESGTSPGRRVRSKPSLPESVTDHYDGRTAKALLFGAEQTADQGRTAENPGRSEAILLKP